MEGCVSRGKGPGGLEVYLRSPWMRCGSSGSSEAIGLSSVARARASKSPNAATSISQRPKFGEQRAQLGCQLRLASHIKNGSPPRFSWDTYGPKRIGRCATPLMDPASILAFLTFASSTSELVLRAIKTIYQAPVEILSLNNELSDLQLVLIELQSFLENNRRGTGAVGSAEHFDTAFKKCFGRIQQLFEQVSELTSSVFTQRANGRHSFERFVWARKKSSVLRLKNELCVVRQTLRDLIEARTALRITNIEVAIESFNVINPSSLQSGRISNEAGVKLEKEVIAQPLNENSSLQHYKNSLKYLPPRSTVAFEAFRRAQCDARCPCPCHFRRRFFNSSLVGSVFGSLFVGYIGAPTLNATCKIRACYLSSIHVFRIVYTFPTWFLKQTLEIALGSNYFGEPEFNIRLHNRVEYSMESSLFQLARKGDVDQMRKKLSARQASPHDVTIRGGLSAFDVSSPSPCSLLLC